MSIRLREVRKAFGANVVLDGLSLGVADGETVAVIGFSGSGKSVLLKTIVGLLRPDGGTVEVDGLDVASLDRHALNALRRRIGYVFQFAALFDSMSVGENVAMGLRRAADLGEAEIRARVEEALRLVDLDGFEDRMPAELSGGQRKRVGLARAVAMWPRYLLYDEPTTGLDPVTTAVIDRLILRMREELGVTSLVITHDMRSALRIADRIALLYNGRIRWAGTAEEVWEAEDPLVRAFLEGRVEPMEEVG